MKVNSISSLKARSGKLRERVRFVNIGRPSVYIVDFDQVEAALKSAEEEAVPTFFLLKWWKDWQGPYLPQHKKCIEMIEGFENQLKTIDKESLSAVQMLKDPVEMT